MILKRIEKWMQFVRKCPHEFSIQYPPAPEYFQENFKANPQNPVELFNNQSDLLLYLHIPFCKHKCSYCNFAVETSKERFADYTEALCEEFDLYSDSIKNSRISGIDIGGGTPTLLPVNLLDKILSKIKFLTKDNLNPNFVSIEATPYTAATEFDKLKLLKDANINRISLGMQSSSTNTLISTNRKEEIGQNERAISNIYQAGFERVNIDLIFGLPSQSEEDWKSNLNYVISLSPTSITTYDCLYSRAGRSFSKSVTLPTMKHYGRLYDIGYNLLRESGYHADYGSVNFSKISGETGTSEYFEGRLLDGKNYLGLGNYSTSLNGNVWYFNVLKTGHYIDQVSLSNPPIGDYYLLPVREMMAKYILSSLNYGIIDTERFSMRFQCSFERMFTPQLEFAVNSGWIEQKNNLWKIKEGEFKNISFLRSLFYSQKAQKWLL